MSKTVNPWRSEESLAQWLHARQCNDCKATNGSLTNCPLAEQWVDLAKKKMERRLKATKGKFVSEKPKELTKLERRMMMGETAKDLKDCLDEYIKGLINDDLTLKQVETLYYKMQNLASINKKYKKSVCGK